MTYLLSWTILSLAGFLTVSTETFTHLLVGRSWKELIREFLVQSFVFAATAFLWGSSVAVMTYFLGSHIPLAELCKWLGFSHLVLMIYPLSIIPTLGYRLEQILRFSVYLVFTSSLLWLGSLPWLTAALVCLPGWILHFFSVEWRVVKQFGDSE